MINYKKTMISDKEWMDRFFTASDFRGCEFNFTNCFVWNDVYDINVALTDTHLLVIITGPMGNCSVFPAGYGDAAPTLLEMKKDADDRGQQFVLVCLTQDNIRVLEEVFPGRFKYIEDRSGFDYIYHIDKLADLKGKDLHPKRTHINRFIENNPDWSFEPITAENIRECLDMHKKWFRLNGDDGFKDIANEDAAVIKALNNFAALKLEGGLLRAGGKVVAFTLGDRINSDTYDIHFEEALRDVKGAYTMINREFARFIRNIHPDIVYINREDDLGIDDLRKAKNSYYPDFMVEKHTAIYMDGYEEA